MSTGSTGQMSIVDRLAKLTSGQSTVDVLASSFRSNPAFLCTKDRVDIDHSDFVSTFHSVYSSDNARPGRKVEKITGIDISNHKSPLREEEGCTFDHCGPVTR